MPRRFAITAGPSVALSRLICAASMLTGRPLCSLAALALAIPSRSNAGPASAALCVWQHLIGRPSRVPVVACWSATDPCCRGAVRHQLRGITRRMAADFIPYALCASLLSASPLLSARSRAQALAYHPARQSAEPGSCAVGLPLPSALSDRAGFVPGERPAAARHRPPVGGVPFRGTITDRYCEYFTPVNRINPSGTKVKPVMLRFMATMFLKVHR